MKKYLAIGVMYLGLATVQCGAMNTANISSKVISQINNKYIENTGIVKADKTYKNRIMYSSGKYVVILPKNFQIETEYESNVSAGSYDLDSIVQGDKTVNNSITQNLKNADAKKDEGYDDLFLALMILGGFVAGYSVTKTGNTVEPFYYGMGKPFKSCDTIGKRD